MDSNARRYAPMNRAHIPGFPYRIPNIDWKTYLPRFKYQKGDDGGIHLFIFHKHIHKLGIEFVAQGKPWLRAQMTTFRL